MRSSLVALTILAAGCLAYACGGEEDGSMIDGDPSSGGSGGSAASGGTGAIGLDGGGTGGSSATGGGGGVGGDVCGGKPCADHKGNKDFIEPGTPGDAGDIFTGGTRHPPGTDGAREPAIVYPNHETMFPINVSRIHHEWSIGGTNDLFLLRFEGPNTTVSVYTTIPNWLPSEEQWDWIAESNRGKSVTLTVFGADRATPNDVWQSAPITLLFSDAEVEGGIYYWSTGTKGVMKALVSDPIPVKFYTDPAAENADTCVACHTLSRDGKRLAVGYGGEKLWEVDVPDRKRILPTQPGQERASAWTTFSPDGKMLLVAASGKLTLIDSDTGAPIGQNQGLVPLPAGKIGTHPDWSALGDKVVFTLGTKGGNKDVEGGAVAILPYDNGVWGSPEIVVPSTGTADNNFFPVWSPDSQWIAFVNAQGKSKDAVTAVLKLVSSKGGEPIALTRVNQRVNNQNGVLEIGNSMPTWAPSTKPGVFWIAFSSLRAYASLRPQDAKEDQIWIAAIDPRLSGDPSYSAFWAPFQSLEEGNHRAFWTHTSDDRQCGCRDACGDGIDNDCNGVADGPECVDCVANEICGDGVDNDCDCVVDDCTREICNDGIDNDGDGAIDENDPQCRIPG
jgi:hypothetical protein